MLFLEALSQVSTGAMLATLSALAIGALAIGPVLAALASLVDAWTDARRASTWTAIVDAPSAPSEIAVYQAPRIDGYRVDVLPDLEWCAAQLDAPLPRALARLSAGPLGMIAA